MFVIGIEILRMLGAVVRNGRFEKGVSPMKSCLVGCGMVLGIGRSVDVGFRLRTRQVWQLFAMR